MLARSTRSRSRSLVLAPLLFALMLAVLPAGGAGAQAPPDPDDHEGLGGDDLGLTTDHSAERDAGTFDADAARAERRALNAAARSLMAATEHDDLVVADGVTQPVFSYADAIRETVHVPGAVSSEDGDDLDVINVDIIRPAASEGELDVPTIIVPSPYYNANGRGRGGGSDERHKPPHKPPFVLHDGGEIEGRLMSRFLNVFGEEGILVDCGLATPDDPCPAEVAGEIALVERGEATFVNKVNHAVAAGAIAVVLYNDQPEGHINSTVNLTDIPVVDIPRDDGLALVEAMQDGDVEVTLEAMFRDVDVFPLYYDNYFVPRGYAVALLDLAGTRGSTGCLDIGGPAEIDNTAKVVEWLAGNATAYDLDGNEIEAHWSNGLSSIVGKSWDGTVANGVAARGTEGLATIVPITAISSWHNYYWSNGVGYAGSPFNLANSIQTNNQTRGVHPAEVCQGVRSELAVEGANPDPETAFWLARNYNLDASNVTASVFVVHGLNDYNVKPHNYGQWWDAIAEHDVPRKIWLSQVAHEKAFDFRRDEWMDTIHRWFDHWLQEIDNGIMDEPMADVEYAPDQWATYDTWPGGSNVTLRLGQPVGQDDPRPGVLAQAGPVNHNPRTQTFVETRQSRNAAAQNGFDERSDRVVFMTEELTEPVRVSGTPRVSLRASIDGPSAVLSAYLVDYGTAERTWDTNQGGIQDLDTITCFGEGTETDTGCYADVVRRTTTAPFYVVARGWADAGFLTGEDGFDPAESHRLEWDIFTDDYVFEAGHRIGIVITGSDTAVRDPYPAASRGDITVHLNGSHIHLPVVGGPRALRDATS